MPRRRVLLACLIVAVSAPLFSQPAIPPQNRYERVFAIVPMVGAGNAKDPKRPLFIPADPRDLFAAGIISFTTELSDDGRVALVEIVARDRSAFAAMLADRRPDVKVFEKGKVTAADLEREFRKHKPSFSADRFVRGR